MQRTGFLVGLTGHIPSVVLAKLGLGPFGPYGAHRRAGGHSVRHIRRISIGALSKVIYSLSQTNRIED